MDKPHSPIRLAIRNNLAAVIGIFIRFGISQGVRRIKRIGRTSAFLLVWICWITGATGAQPTVAIGAGSYATTLPAGARQPQKMIYQTDHLSGKMPTNRWWSSLAWVKFGERQYPHPLAVQESQRGLRVYYPGNRLAVDLAGIYGAMPAKTGEDLVLGSSAVEHFDDARIAGFSDWWVSVRLTAGANGMTVSYGHGSPFVYALYDGEGEARIDFGEAPAIWSGNANSPVLGVTVRGSHYGLFGPAGSTWKGIGEKSLVNLAGAKRYFSLALMPHDDPKTLELFRHYAYAHVVDTHVSWRYDPQASTVITDFVFKTRLYEGDATGTLFALYPHQWRNCKEKLAGGSYASVRGAMKLIEANSFTTVLPYHGVLPALPRAGGDEKRLAGYLKAELDGNSRDVVRDTYWEGKWLGRLADQIPIAEEYGLQEAADALRQRLRQRLEQWFIATDASGAIKHNRLFYYNSRWGTLIGYPAGYGSDTEINDHHFHYGYFIRAAAEIARTDPSWAAEARFGGIVKLLIRDIANPTRDDPQFPFLRNFDPFAGHSWASGTANFGDGNNQESSSEAINAWYGLILWGAFTGDTATRDLGIWLYTTEAASAQEYWLDLRKDDFDNLPAVPSSLAMLWGGKGVNATWFSNRPEVVHAINWMPLHGGSLYLDLDPGAAQRNYDALVRAKGGTTWTQWPDLIWMYRALSDPDDALKQLERDADRTAPEPGNSRANLYHWIAAFKELGSVDAAVTADDPLAAVFRNNNKRTYVCYNPAAIAKTIRFSDGFVLQAAPRKWAIQYQLLRVGQ